MDTKTIELKSTQNRAVVIRAIEGHFVTRHSHVTHCIDLTQIKSQMNTAKATAKVLASKFTGIPVDTVITLERTKMVGAFLANELASSGININRDIAVISPEVTADQLILRDNFLPYVNRQRVVLITATSTTGMTLRNALEGIRYYGGDPVGAAAIFGSDVNEITLASGEKIPVTAIFNTDDIQNYASYSATECPLCKKGLKVDALVNSYGYSKV